MANHSAGHLVDCLALLTVGQRETHWVMNSGTMKGRLKADWSGHQKVETMGCSLGNCLVLHLGMMKALMMAVKMAVKTVETMAVMMGLHLVQMTAEKRALM